mmetsp:Transcript_5789/g.12746  ORF Transcript_5789/g.12746 Transcript_5789/m.12746 type:complete len:111 (+) Transcript_5789:191-523(+)
MEDDGITERDRMRAQALAIYRGEMNRPPSLDLGSHGISRAALRRLSRKAVLDSAEEMRTHLHLDEKEVEKEEELKMPPVKVYLRDRRDREDGGGGLGAAKGLLNAVRRFL